MEKLTKECVLQSAARLEQESQDAVMRDIPQFFEAEIVTRFAGAAPQKKELNPLVFNMERGICLAETVDFLRECPALRPYDLILANELDSGCARSGERDTAAEIARCAGNAVCVRAGVCRAEGRCTRVSRQCDLFALADPVGRGAPPAGAV